MKKSPKMFTVEVHPPGRPGKAWIGAECGQVLSINLIPNRTGQEPITYSAPIEKIHATLARWHSKEHPTGRKRLRLFGISEEQYRFEKDMILAAKFAIQRGGITLPVFVTLARKAFRIAHIIPLCSDYDTDAGWSRVLRAICAAEGVGYFDQHWAEEAENQG